MNVDNKLENEKYITIALKLPAHYKRLDPWLKVKFNMTLEEAINNDLESSFKDSNFAEHLSEVLNTEEGKGDQYAGDIEDILSGEKSGETIEITIQMPAELCKAFMALNPGRLIGDLVEETAIDAIRNSVENTDD